MRKYGNRVKKPASHHRGGSIRLLAKTEAALIGKSNQPNNEANK